MTVRRSEKGSYHGGVIGAEGLLHDLEKVQREEFVQGAHEFVQPLGSNHATHLVLDIVP